MGRYDTLHRIQQLDPVQDHCQIYHLMTGYEFPTILTTNVNTSATVTLITAQVKSLATYS
jgi:hypothetical protein